MMENKMLKPCPFCGFYGTVKFDTDGTKDSMGRKWAYTVSCNSCCASTGVCWSREMAIEAWNRRANDAEVHSSACINQEAKQNEKRKRF